MFVVGLLFSLLVPLSQASAITSESVSAITRYVARGELSTTAYTGLAPRPDLHSIKCFACLMEECPEVRRYPANQTVWGKCSVSGMMAPKFGDTWLETVDGCYISYSDFRYYPHWTSSNSKRSTSANSICDTDKAHQLPNTTSPPHTAVAMVKRKDDPPPNNIPALITSPYPLKCLSCADPLCTTESRLAPNSTTSIECWTVSTMGPGEVISFPKYENKWLMTTAGCYVPFNEVSLQNCTNNDYERCLPYCEPPPHYWASIKNASSMADCPRNCTGDEAYVNDWYVVDFECWAIGDEVQGNSTWYLGSEVYYYGFWYTFWWPKAALGAFGGTGEPPVQCDANQTIPKPPSKHTRDFNGVDTRDVGHAAPRAVQNVYAVVNEVDVRCRLCTKRICPYYTVYQPGESMNFDCFVYGSVIEGSDVWFKSAEAVRCYVPRRYVTLNGGSSISYCRNDGSDLTPPSDPDPEPKSTTTPTSTPPSSPIKRAPSAAISDPSRSSDPPLVDSCQRDASAWQTMCFNQALSCCAKQTPIDSVYWDCMQDWRWTAWKGACKDLQTQTNCSMALRLGSQMEGCEGGDVYRDPV